MIYDIDTRTYNRYFSIIYDNEKECHLEQVAENSNNFKAIAENLKVKYASFPNSPDFYYIGKINEKGLVQIRAIPFGSKGPSKSSAYSGPIIVPAYARIDGRIYDIIIDSGSFVNLQGISGCSEVYIPSKLTHIKSNPFYYGSISKIFVDYQNPCFISSHNAGLLTKDGSRVIAWAPKDKLSLVELVSTVKYIDDWAFANTNIMKLSLQNGVEEIGINSFCYSKIESIFLPVSIKNVKKWTFANCTSLRTIVCSSSTKLEEDAYPRPHSATDKPQVKIKRYKPQAEDEEIVKFIDGRLPSTINSNKARSIFEKSFNFTCHLAGILILSAVVVGFLEDLFSENHGNYETIESIKYIPERNKVKIQDQEGGGNSLLKSSNEVNIEAPSDLYLYDQCNHQYQNVNVNSNSNPISQPQLSQKTVVQNKCPYCKNGEIIQHEFASTLGVDGPRVYCNKCNQSWNYGTIHTHHQCQHCGGRGYTEYEY